MSFFDRSDSPLLPAAGVPPRTAAEVRAALLGLDTSDVPYVIRDGAPEGVDLVGEWQHLRGTRRGVFGHFTPGEAFQIRMRLVPEAREVRAMDHSMEFTLSGDGFTRRRTTSHSRGQMRRRFQGTAHGPGPDGRREKTETHRFDTDDLKHALQHVVLTGGWSWHGLVRGSL
ncbi:hypothetical protein [Streptomyces sp. NPDC049040]|uniref:hypothetical protein n=1 Tax=Streptomyces sp. NPDC049040 TaxID=3365593 RepID=UPI003711CC16